MNKEPSNKYVPIRCVDVLYKRITGHPHNGLEHARTLFFYEIGYHFLIRISRSVTIDIDPPTVAWSYPS